MVRAAPKSFGFSTGSGLVGLVVLLVGLAISFCMRFYRLCDQRRNSSSHFGGLIEMTPKEHTCLRRPSESTWWFYSQLCEWENVPLSREDRRLVTECCMDCLEVVAPGERPGLPAEMTPALNSLEWIH